MADDLDLDFDMGLNVEDDGEDDYVGIDPNDDNILAPIDEDAEEPAPAEARGDKDEIKAEITAADDAEADVHEATQGITCGSHSIQTELARKNKAICPNPVRTTLPFMTKYEKARVLGERAIMLANGHPPLVDLNGETNLHAIALRELMEKRLPLIIRRPLPDGTCEDWKVSELKLPP